ncbi:MAG: serine/threonine protein kinase, partial [Acidobacteria bacterium]|nr:serine/threonine protein kinase [Acidobacteriota bacterium]
MSEDRDRLLDLAKDVAEGSRVDWEARLEELGEAGEEARVAAGLRRLAEMQSRFRTASAGLELTAGGDLPAGWRWGHLEVGALLGSGSFGEVYRAYDPVLRREVALKLRARPRASAAESTFLAEARRLARVRHPNVLAVHGADVHDGRAGLWADLLEGETLEQGLAQGPPFPPQEVLGIALQLVEALAAVHGAGLVHGDIKASNVMRCPGDRIVLMDFGAGSDKAGDGGSRPAAGSPLSMAPELFGGRPASAAADLYSTGVLLFRLLTGRYPVAAETVEELASRHRQGWTPEWGSGVRAPRSLRHLAERLLALDPAGRPTAAETLEALRSIEEEPRRRRKRLAVAAVVGSLLVVLGASTAGWLSAKSSARRAEEARREAEATSGFLTDLLLAPDITQ